MQIKKHDLEKFKNISLYFDTLLHNDHFSESLNDDDNVSIDISEDDFQLLESIRQRGIKTLREAIQILPLSREYLMDSIKDSAIKRIEMVNTQSKKLYDTAKSSMNNAISNLRELENDVQELEAQINELKQKQVDEYRNLCSSYGSKAMYRELAKSTQKKLYEIRKGLVDGYCDPVECSVYDDSLFKNEISQILAYTSYDSSQTIRIKLSKNFVFDLNCMLSLYYFLDSSAEKVIEFSVYSEVPESILKKLESCQLKILSFSGQNSFNMNYEIFDKVIQGNIETLEELRIENWEKFSFHLLRHNFPKLKKLKLHHKVYIEDESEIEYMRSFLRRHQEIDIIELEGILNNPFNSISLSQIKELGLSLVGTQITRSMIQQLSNLETLKLHNIVMIDAQALTALESAINLRKLELDYINFGHQDFTFLENLENLEYLSLNLSESKITKEDLASLSNSLCTLIPRLHHISLRLPYGTDLHINKPCPLLEYVQFENIYINNTSTSNLFTNGNKFKTLSLIGVKIGVDVLKEKEFRALEVLTLDSVVGLQSNHIQYLLSNGQNIQHIKLHDLIFLEDKNLRVLNCMVLKTLSLKSINKVSHTCLKSVLEKQPRLESLELMNLDQIQDDLFYSLSNYYNLSELVLVENIQLRKYLEILDKYVFKKKHSRLITLRIINQTIDSQHIIECMTHCPYLREIDLSHSIVSNFREIFDALTLYNKNLIVVQLENNYDIDMIDLYILCKFLPKLQLVNLQNSFFGNESLELLFPHISFFY